MNKRVNETKLRALSRSFNMRNSKWISNPNNKKNYIREQLAYKVMLAQQTFGQLNHKYQQPLPPNLVQIKKCASRGLDCFIWVYGNKHG